MREGTRSLVDCHLCPGRTDPDVTWRFDGRPRQLFTTVADDLYPWVSSNTEAVAPQSAFALDIATNAENLTDVWAAHGTNNELHLVRLDP
ncbi:MAG: hypothetical protein HUU25_15400 [Candidatus Sumerlaeia bacterium]|nr:hypothetical protein [Candidatus Sumerlaeia bacterium]